MRKYIYLIALLFVCPFTLFAQNRIIKGSVTDEKRIPIPGITVQVKGGNAIQTNVDRKIDNLPYVQAPARLFTPNKSELYPFPQTALDSYNGLLTQDYGY